MHIHCRCPGYLVSCSIVYATRGLHSCLSSHLFIEIDFCSQQKSDDKAHAHCPHEGIGDLESTDKTDTMYCRGVVKLHKSFISNFMSFFQMVRSREGSGCPGASFGFHPGIFVQRGHAHGAGSASGLHRLRRRLPYA